MARTASTIMADLHQHWRLGVAVMGRLRRSYHKLRVSSNLDTDMYLITVMHKLAFAKPLPHNPMSYVYVDLKPHTRSYFTEYPSTWQPTCTS